MKFRTGAAIVRFILGPLETKLREDAKKLRMITERDLEDRIVHHLSNRIDEEKFVITGNKTFRHLRIEGKSKKKKKFLMPDIIVRDKDENNRILIVIEIKHQIDSASAFLSRTADEKEVEYDCKKLNRYLKDSYLKPQIIHGFFIYLYNDRGYTESKIKKWLEEKFDNDKLDAIIINRYWNHKENKWYKKPEIAKIKKEFDKLYDIDVLKTWPNN